MSFISIFPSSSPIQFTSAVIPWYFFSLLIAIQTNKYFSRAFSLIYISNIFKFPVQNSHLAIEKNFWKKTSKFKEIAS
jgi:hypothetical protein